MCWGYGDEGLRHLYGVTTKALNQAVKRNIERFPDDFMFRLTADEYSRSQSVTLKLKRGHEFVQAHDRFLCIDDTVYHIGASLKDLGKKWFAFNRMEIPASTLFGKMKE